MDSRKLDGLMNLSGELAIVRARYSQLVGALVAEAARLKGLENKAAQARSRNDALSKELRAGGVKKSATACAEMDALLAEIASGLSRGDSSTLLHSLDELTGTLGKISGDIQTWVMLSRLVPAAEMLSSVRAQAVAFRRDAEVTVEDNDGASLDKRIAEGLSRQTAEACIALSERCGGKIKLSAANRDNNIFLDLSVSGGDFAPEQVVRQMAEAGMAQPGGNSARQTMALLLHDDFPAGTTISTMSAKLRALRDATAALNGSVELDFVSGAATVSLKIPLTLVIIQALLVSLGGESYAFPLSAVVEIVKTADGDIYSVDGNNTIKLRDHALSLVDPGRIIGITCASGEKRSGKVVVITDGREKIGVSVDSLIGETEIVIKSLPEHFAAVKGINGASILGDGSVALILDPAAIIAMAR
jgi:two-component system chemotaxis sensor kinase CheA